MEKDRTYSVLCSETPLSFFFKELNNLTTATLSAAFTIWKHDVLKSNKEATPRAGLLMKSEVNIVSDRRSLKVRAESSFFARCSRNRA